MIDKNLERQTAECKELKEQWQVFYDFFQFCTKQLDQPLTPEYEQQFLTIKSRIAMLHDSFMDAIERDRNIGQEMLNIVMRSISLKYLRKLNPADYNKIESDWHQSYMLLNEAVAELDQKRAELLPISEKKVQAEKRMALMKQKLFFVLNSAWFKVSMILLVVLGGTVGVQGFGFYDFNELGKIEALHTPYRVGKGILHTVYNEDSPWVSAASVPRGSVFTANKSYEAPTVGGGGVNEIADKIPNPEIREALKTAIDYERVVIKAKGADVSCDVHTVLFKTAEEARKVANAWKKYMESIQSSNLQRNQQFREQNKLIQNSKTVNAVVIMTCNDSKMLEDLMKALYNEKP